jgi:hypothetical protein
VNVMLILFVSQRVVLVRKMAPVAVASGNVCHVKHDGGEKE